MKWLQLSWSVFFIRINTAAAIAKCWRCNFSLNLGPDRIFHTWAVDLALAQTQSTRFFHQWYPNFFISYYKCYVEWAFILFYPVTGKSSEDASIHNNTSSLCGNTMGCEIITWIISIPFRTNTPGAFQAFHYEIHVHPARTSWGKLRKSCLTNYIIVMYLFSGLTQLLPSHVKRHAHIMRFKLHNSGFNCKHVLFLSTTVFILQLDKPGSNAVAASNKPGQEDEPDFYEQAHMPI